MEKVKINISRENLWYMLIIIVIGLLYAFARFPGIDSHSGYFGFTFKLIYPESFPGDNVGQHPSMISLYIILVKIFGELWLDDRFVLAIYFILIIISLLGVDRLAKLFGVKNKMGRLAVMSILLVDHMFIDNLSQLMDMYSFRPSTFAQPLGIWIAYFLLINPKVLTSLSLSCILALTTIKNGWFPLLSTSLLALREVFNIKWGKIAVAIVIALTVIFSGNYLWSLAKGTIYQNVFLFDNAIFNLENSETNPFMDGLGPFVYISFILSMLLVKIPDVKIEARIRAICIIGILVYLLGGIYYTFAPDQIKIPLFVPFALSRSTWWLQLLGFILLSCVAIMRFEKAPPRKKIIFACLLFLLYVFPVFDYLSFRSFFVEYSIRKSRLFMLGGFIPILVLLFLISYHFKNIKIFSRILENQVIMRTIVFIPIIVCTICLLSIKTHSRMQQFSFMFDHGILGGTPNAKWVGVTEFFRYETDKNSIVLSIVGEGDRFTISDYSLKVRSGRTMHASHGITSYLDYNKQIMKSRYSEIIKQLEENFRNCDLINAKNNIDLLGGTDYLVVPISYICPLESMGFNLIKEINSFKIYEQKR